MVRHHQPTEAELYLGSSLEALRLNANISRMQLGKIVNVTEQQIARFEKGAFIPLPMLELITEALNMPIAKKHIRRISFLRKLEIETGEENQELKELYKALFE